MKILGIITARGGSKGVPGKNIKNLAGKPLLAYTVEAAKSAKGLDRTILSSEDEKIINIARKLSVDIPFVRPATLAGDTTGSLEVIQHAVNLLKQRGDEYDAVCLLQPTTPFRSQGIIDRAIEKFISGSYDSVISMREVPAEYNPHWIFEQKDGKLEIATGENEIIKQRQDLPKAYFRDGAVYITKTSVLLEQNSIYGDRIGFIDTTGSAYINIDTMEDWVKAEKIVALQLNSEQNDIPKTSF